MVAYPTFAGRVFHFETKQGLVGVTNTPPADGENLATWSDLFSDNDMGTGAFPVFRDSGYNGHGFVEFVDADGDGMFNTDPTSWTSDNPGTYFVVYRQQTNGELFIIANIQGGAALVLYETAGDQIVWGDGTNDIVIDVPDTVVHIATMVHNGDSTSAPRLDGVALSTGDAGAGGTVSDMYMNRSGANNSHGDLELVAWIGYDRALDAGEINEVEYYLDQTYALGKSISTPAGTIFPFVGGPGLFPSDG